MLSINVLQQIPAARSYKKMHNLAGITIVNISRNIRRLHVLPEITKSTAKIQSFAQTAKLSDAYFVNIYSKCLVSE